MPEYLTLPPERDPDSAWQDEANCLGVDPDLFFPEHGASTREAKEICRGCVVRENCLDYALGQGERFGIWGGLSERERRRLRRSLAQTSMKEQYTLGGVAGNTTVAFATELDLL